MQLNGPIPHIAKCIMKAQNKLILIDLALTLKVGVARYMVSSEQLMTNSDLGMHTAPCILLLLSVFITTEYCRR
jgi:hypothetical protein